MSRQGRQKMLANREALMFGRRARVYLAERLGVVFTSAPKRTALLEAVEKSLGYTPGSDRIRSAINALNGAMDFKGKLVKGRAPRGTFYDTPEWQALRYKALRLNNGKCELCGHGKRDGAKLHVDHIKPRSLHPELELELSNLQVLCEPCNLGKSNKDDTDWRAMPEGSKSL